MRALCGAIITAGSLIGLGLSAIGVGLRYQLYPYHNEKNEAQWVFFKHLDTTLMVAVIALLISLVIGMGIAFLGLAYHHNRRHQALLRKQAKAGRGQQPVAGAV